ncbi:C40 family peptidase [Actinophytocola glycyrrhizae]|uniref:C40 family peptidase n=1 Tax=Actinophytocola glycyrrhizae TaxID=2044873 RepID=A0ABV9SBQ9_9PSEU
MNGRKIMGAAVTVLVAFVLGLSVISGTPVATEEQPPAGGCTVTIDATGAGASGTQKSAELNANQMAAARTVVGVGTGMRIAARGIAIALGTAMQESTMNPAAVNGRSIGLFQQQGTLYADVDRTDAAAASRAFYTQLVSRVPTYADPAAGTFAAIAQAVQRSGAGAGKYAVWQRWATALAAQLLGEPQGPSPAAETSPVTCEDGGGSGQLPIRQAGLDVILPKQAGIDGSGSDVIVRFPSEAAAIAAAAALSHLGTPYAWGGGGPTGPTQGIRDGGVADRHGDYKKTGFDCSGLTEYAYAQAGIAIGGDSRTQYASGGTRHPFREALPGDLLFSGNTPATIHHVAIYLGRIYGRDYVVEAPQSGSVVKVSMTPIVGQYRTDVVRPWD